MAVDRSGALNFLTAYTGGQYAKAFALAAQEQVIAPCACGYENCPGWRMASVDEVTEFVSVAELLPEMQANP